MKLTHLDIRSTLEAYRSREFKPSEIVRTCLEEMDRRNPELNAYLQVRPEETLAEATRLDGRLQEADKLPLFGIPLAVKDNFLIEGWRCTAGSKILKNYLSPYTATSIRRLQEAGAIVVGKTNLDEFAMGSSTENSAYGPSCNPWDKARVPGGSSGGSAVALAAGMCLGALGTDTGGSVRQPASLCGVVGLKPTYGRVSRYGVVAFGSSLDQIGPMAQSSWDAARILEVMAGYGGFDATTSRGVVPNYTQNLRPGGQFRVGVCSGWLEKGLQPAVEKNFVDVIDRLKDLGCEIIEVDLPHVRYALSAYYLIAPSEASSNLARFDGVHYGHRSEKAETLDSTYRQSRGEGLGPETKLRIMLGTYALSSGYYDAYYNKANQIRSRIKADFDDAFEKCDVIASPASPTTAFRIGEKAADPIAMYLSDVFTVPANLAGLPAISIPSGLDENALPMGVQFIGRAFDEATLFQLGTTFEQARGRFASPGETH